MIGGLIGDIVGSTYEFHNTKTKDFKMFTKHTSYTDDSVMTLAVCEALQKGYGYDSEKIVKTLKKWGRTYPNAGYGGHFFYWLFSDDTKPYNSCGNGSAMRVSACGWYGRDEEEVKALAKSVTEVTHNHPEGIKGAEVTAMCVYYARKGKDKEFIKKYVEQYYNLDFDYEELRQTYTHEEEICQNTVPQAIYCFLISKDFEDCLKTTISIGGDCDTTAAISCAIAEAYYKYIPANLLERALKYLPEKKGKCDAQAVVKEFVSFKFASEVNSEEIGNDTKILSWQIEMTKGQCELEWSYSKSYQSLAKYVISKSLETYFDDEDGCFDEVDEMMTAQEFHDIISNLDKEQKTKELIKIDEIIDDFYKCDNFADFEKCLAIINESIQKVQKNDKFSIFENPSTAIEHLNKLNVDCNAYSLVFDHIYELK